MCDSQFNVHGSIAPDSLAHATSNTKKKSPSIRLFRCFVVALKVLPISFLLGVYLEFYFLLLERRCHCHSADAVPMAAAAVVVTKEGVCCFISSVAKCVISISYWNGFGWFSVQTWLCTHTISLLLA